MARHQQSYLNSCGATALLCAASELGITQIPANPNYTLWIAGPRLMAVNQTCETILYQVTSNNPVGANPQHWGYSMPTGVVTCARFLSLRVLVMAYQTWSVRALKIFYRQEVNALRTMNVLREDRHSASAFRPNPRQRELKILMGRGRGNFGALHYVMIRPDGTVMEPGTGNDYPGIANVKTALGMHGTGLSIFVQR